MSSNINWEKEKNNLYNLLIIEKLSYEFVGRKYGCSGAWIKKVCKKMNIDVGQRRKVSPNENFNHKKKIYKTCINCGKEYHPHDKNSKYCSLSCFFEYQHKKRYEKIVNGDNDIMRSTYNAHNFKKDILKEQGGVCAIPGCGQEPFHNGKPLVFILDHIDGHASNNRRENLRLVCPNCDSQLDTYKSKNKNGEREYYRYYHR